MKIQHLYVHIPFCPHICPYCSFHVSRVHKQRSHQFLLHLIEEYQNIKHQLDLTTLFLGGGTPTALSTEQITRLLDILLKSTPARLVEITSECNPSTLPFEKAKTMTSFGVNRISIGAQSFDPSVLQILGRTHSVEAIRQCVCIAREAGFTNINLDLIFGVPGQTLASWEKTLESALELGPQHLSCYGLTYEEDTDFFLRHQRGELKENIVLETEMYRLADRLLTQSGFSHYEVSNYAKPGYESLHNLGYWRGEDFYGIGPSAVSTIGQFRHRNSGMTPDATWTVEETEPLNPTVLASERMVFGLRTSEGIGEASFKKRFGFSPSERWSREIRDLTRSGALVEDSCPQESRYFRLTERGREVADEIATYFV